MPRQRSKKLSATRKADSNDVAKLPSVDVEHEGDGEGDNESDDILDKDSEEEELDRLVLGGGFGFKVQWSGDTDMLDAVSENGENEEPHQDFEGEAGLEGVDDADLFFVDSGPSALDPSSLLPQPDLDDDGPNRPAWEDSDDDRMEISLAGDTRLRKLRRTEEEDLVNGKEYARRLRMQYERLNPLPEWAQTSSRPIKRRRRSSAGSESSISSNDMDIDDSDLSTLPLARLLQDAGSLIRTVQSGAKRTKLRPEVIDIQQTRAIPLVQPSSITSLSFHPEYPVLLSSGPASTLYLHHIDSTAQPTPHPLLTSVHIRHTPLHRSEFLYPLGDKIIFAGRRRYFHTWDLPSGAIQKVSRVYGQKEEQKSMENFRLSPCGRYMALVGTAKKGGGIVNILDANTTQWIAAMRTEGTNGVADFAWWSNGEGLTVVSKGGEVAEWSMEKRSYVARWNDEGFAPTVLTLGGPNGPAALGGDRWVVIGSQSGVVNIYDRRSFMNSKNEIEIQERPSPKKSFEQFLRATSHLVISPDGQLLAFSSMWKKDALRLVHLPSCTVYRNWPTDKTPLGRITAVAFGRSSDMLAVANEAGKIRLWEIRS